MARRGDALREHILQTAKQVFLEMGFERASMDEVARRAGTSKRSLYAHFESKDLLFYAVIGFVRGLFLARLKDPASYAEDPVEALTLFLGRYLESMVYRQSIQFIRLTLAEVARFPEGAAQHHGVMFVEVTRRIASYLRLRLDVPGSARWDVANRLVGQVLFPHLPRALFGVTELLPGFDEHGISPKIDLETIRRGVAAEIERLPKPKKRRAQPS